MNIYKLIKDYIYAKNNPKPYVYSVKKTIDIIVEKGVSVSRFGDGEFDIILEINHPKFQHTNKRLKKLLMETLKKRNEKIMICIPGVFSYDEYNKFTINTAKHWAKFVMKNRRALYRIFDFKYRYGDSLFTRQYIDLKNKSNTAEYYSNVKRIWDNRSVVIVEGRFTRFGAENDLLSNARRVSRILCPENDAFDKYDEILDVCLKQDKKTLFLIALGPSATVMAVDLAERGYQAIDIGHLDIEYEWFLRKLSTKKGIKNKYVNEVDGGNIIQEKEFEDLEYVNSIIYNTEAQTMGSKVCEF